MPILTTRGGADPKVMGTIESGSSDASFGTLQSPIRHMVPELLTSRKIPEEQQQQEQEYITFLRD